MIKASYTVSPVLRDSFRKIELLRQKILLTPLSPDSELKLRWEANLDRIFWSLALDDNPLTKHDIAAVIINKSRKGKFGEDELDVIMYKAALDYIHQNWLVNKAKIEPKTIFKLYEVACRGEFKGKEADLMGLLEYIQLDPDNPVVQAAIAQFEIAATNPFTKSNGRISRLITYLLFCKSGYDFRGLFVLDEYWRRDLHALKEIIDETVRTRNLTLWITYFSKAVITQLEKIVENISFPHSNLNLTSNFWKLNERQKEILNILEEPKKSIDNKTVQKLFKISQITASRDLARLASLGLLFIHGKGRSVKYTKV